MEHPDGRDPVASQHRQCKIFGSGAAQVHPRKLYEECAYWHKMIPQLAMAMSAICEYDTQIRMVPRSRPQLLLNRV
jgi:hypothetical protein